MKTRLLLALFTTLIPSLGSAQSADAAREIVAKSQHVLYGFKTLTVAGAMTLSRGTESIGERTISVQVIEREAPDALDQARIVISAPTALKDTQLLSWSSDTGNEQQWLVTLRTTRTESIANRGRQAAYVSSTFTYENILKWQLDDYTYARAGQAPCPAGTCTVVDATPRNRFSSYARLKAYYD